MGQRERMGKAWEGFVKDWKGLEWMGRVCKGLELGGKG